MNIEIKPEDIDQYVKDAILKSTIGETLVVSIQKEINELMSGYHSPIRQFVKNVLAEYVADYMKKPEVQEMLVKAVSNIIRPETLELIVKHGIYQLQKDIRENRENYT